MHQVSLMSGREACTEGELKVRKRNLRDYVGRRLDTLKGLWSTRTSCRRYFIFKSTLDTPCEL